MAVEEVSNEQERFFSGAPESEWYKNLKRYGSCLKLLSLLEEESSLIHQLGPEGITVLHKGVEHGCVALVRFILVDMFDDQGLCKCRLHVPIADAALPGVANLTREQLLRKTSSYGSTAVNMAVVSGSPKMVTLLRWAIEMSGRVSGELPEYISSVREQETYDAILSITNKKRGYTEGIQGETTDNVGNELLVPNVRDEDINILTSTSSSMNMNVISIIENILEDPGEDIDKELLDVLKERCQKHVDFEFVPVAHVFLHYLHSLCLFDQRGDIELSKFREEVLRKIFEMCKDAHDGEEGGRGAMLKTLFNILDPRGRPFLHAMFDDSSYIPATISQGVLERLEISPSIIAECMNVKDGAGRTMVHHWCMHGGNTLKFFVYEHPKLMEVMDFGVSCTSSEENELNVLKKWCFPNTEWGSSRYVFKPIQFAVLFDTGLNIFWAYNNNDYGSNLERGSLSPLQLASMLGRTTILEAILSHHTIFNSSYDHGLGNGDYSVGNYYLPAIHVAAGFGQVEAIQSILKFPVYDPIFQDGRYGTALHALLDEDVINFNFRHVQEIILHHVLPTSEAYKQLNNDFFKLHFDEERKPKMYSANEISCINLLLQAGIDIWTPHVYTKKFPNPGRMANDEARKWWYEKVVNEVVTLKTSINGAANATSVIAALVATASFIGPLQPPLGYNDSNYVQTDRSPVRVYLVCNSLSFFFSIASILMAVLPAIPMPKESLYDELVRSQRCLKGAALMLLISIICILISFSSASLVVVSSEWHERQLVVACVIFGGVICLVVLVIYIIRLLRMLFHKNDWFRRKFAKHMYF